MTGHVLFHLGGLAYAAPVPQVREVLRLRGADLVRGGPGEQDLLRLPGRVLPVRDLRPAEAQGGDVLVLADGTGDLAVVVDAVESVLAPGELVPLAVPAVLERYPAYVREVRRRQPSGDPDPGEVVFVVDAPALSADRVPVRTGRPRPT